MATSLLLQPRLGSALNCSTRPLGPTITSQFTPNFYRAKRNAWRSHRARTVLRSPGRRGRLQCCALQLRTISPTTTNWMLGYPNVSSLLRAYDIDLDAELGSGAYGVVRLARHKVRCPFARAPARSPPRPPSRSMLHVPANFLPASVNTIVADTFRDLALTLSSASVCKHMSYGGSA